MPRTHGPKPGIKYLGTNPHPFGTILCATRRKRGLTQAQLAERAGISRRAVTYYERETTNPSPDVVQKLAQVLRVPVTHFLPHNDQPTAQVVDRALSLRLETAQKLPPSARAEVKRLVDTLAKAHQIHDSK